MKTSGEPEAPGCMVAQEHSDGQRSERLSERESGVRSGAPLGAPSEVPWVAGSEHVLETVTERSLALALESVSVRASASVSGQGWG